MSEEQDDSSLSRPPPAAACVHGPHRSSTANCCGKSISRAETDLESVKKILNYPFSWLQVILLLLCICVEITITNKNTQKHKHDSKHVVYLFSCHEFWALIFGRGVTATSMLYYRHISSIQKPNPSTLVAKHFAPLVHTIDNIKNMPLACIEPR